MGVKGLTTFISKEFHGWKRQELTGYLVIDGYSLCYRLYTLQWNRGGEYPQYRAKVLEMFRALLSAKIRPIVIFDGIDYKLEKLATLLKRRRESIKFIRENLSKTNPSRARTILPMLAYEVVQHTLRELGITSYVVDGEADGVIVEVANYLGCPVLGSDSDYFMFDISGGYIPTDKLYWTSSPVTCDVFLLSAFLERFKFKQRSLLYAIPAIVGNDFLTSVFSEKLITCMARSHGIRVPDAHPLSQVVKCIHLYSSAEAFILKTKGLVCSDQIEKNYHASLAMYSCLKRTDPESLMSECVLYTVNKEPLPEWMVRRYRRGNISHYIMDALVLGESILRIIPDVPMKPSSLNASVVLRQRLHFLLHVPVMAEYTRVGGDLSVRQVNSLPVTVVSPQLLSPYPVEVFYEVLGCESSLLMALDDSWKFVAAVTRFWAVTGDVSAHLVEAMMYCNVLCFTHNASLNGLRKKCVFSDAFQYSYKWMAALHAFAQWQCCYLDALSINQLLDHPFAVVSPAYLYDGTVALYVAQDIPSALSKFPINRHIYQTMHDIVLRDRLVAAPKKDPTPSKQTKGHITKKSSQQVQATPSFAHVNPFSLLECDPDSD